MGARLVIRAIDGRRVEEDFGYPLDQDRVVIGRGRSADVRIPHATVSEIHALVERTTEGYRVSDQGSTNGTWVGEQRLVPQRPRRIQDGDVVRIGLYVLALEAGVPGLPSTAPLTADHTAELARQLVRHHLLPGQEGARPPRLVVIAGNPTGAHVDLSAPPARIRIGRAETCQLQLDDPDVSREHVEIQRDLQGVHIEDLDSKNGVLVCGKPTKQARLSDGDEIELGGCTLLFEEPAELPLEALEAAADQALEAPAALPDADPATPENPGPPAGSDAAQPEHHPSLPDADNAPPKAAAEAPQAQPRAPSLAPDLLIYGLASLVLVLSVAGLVLLLRQ